MRWILPEPIPEGVSVVDFLLSQRKISAEAVESFFDPDLSTLHDSSLLYDTRTAARVILEAVAQGKKIFVHGDYDVDGICATAVMWDFLYRKLKANVMPFIPNRFDDGYGLSDSSIQSILDQGGELIITVDCGIKDVDRVKDYTAQGVEFVVTDHHTLPENAEGEHFVSGDALAVVHPRYPGHEYPFGEICGTTVAWKLCQAIAAAADMENTLYEYLDLVALATSCDVMPLVDENRVIVSHGVSRLRNTERLGLRELISAAGHQMADIDTYHLGYVIGPRLNAAGRLESAVDSLRLLTTTSHRQAVDLAAKLGKLNVERQELTQKLMQQAEEQISQAPTSQKLFFVHGPGWPEGVVGLVAGKLAERYSRPVLVASQSGNEMTGSARGPANFHLANVFRQLGHLLLRHGGHAQAAGFGLAVDQLGEFSRRIIEIADSQLTEADLEPQLHIDIVAELSVLTVDQLQELQKFGPFGNGNPKPVWAIRDMQILSVRAIGRDNQHLKFTLANEYGHTISAIAFRAPDAWKELKPGDIIDLAGDANINEWNGRSEIQLVVKDVRAAS